MTDITQILSEIEQGDPNAAERLLPLVYDELRKLASARMALERPGQTLPATGLVHEAYLRLVGSTQARSWDGRGHFFAAAAEAMRRILIENARRKQSSKHGGDWVRQQLEDVDFAASDESEQLLALDDALAKLATSDPQVAELVKLRYFTGLTNKQAAEALDISPRTANHYWAYAKAWLREELK